MRRASIVLCLIALATAAAAAVYLARRHGRHSAPPETRLVVSGRTVSVPAGTTFGQAVRRLRLSPASADLLDVRGRVLRRGAVHGSVLLDGAPAPATTVLRDGDRLAAVAARDRREPVRTVRAAPPGGVLDDPQFTLARSPGTMLTTVGVVSHEVAGVSYRHGRGGAASVPRAVALTFDDGPWPGSTASIVHVLHRLHVHATFFVVGYLVDEHPQLVRAEVRAGMTIGNHTYNHPEVPPFDELPAPLREVEIGLGAERLERLGVEPRLFRPPGGAVSSEVVAAAAARGERVVLWSVDPRDWQPGVSSKEIVRRVLGAVRPGAIVVLHDGGGDRSATLRALPAIVRGIRRRGLRLVAVPAR